MSSSGMKQAKAKIPIYADVWLNECPCGHKTVVWAYFPPDRDQSESDCVLYDIKAAYCPFCGRRLTEAISFSRTQKP